MALGAVDKSNVIAGASVCTLPQHSTADARFGSPLTIFSFLFGCTRPPVPQPIMARAASQLAAARAFIPARQPVAAGRGPVRVAVRKAPHAATMHEGQPTHAYPVITHDR